MPNVFCDAPPNTSLNRSAIELASHRELKWFLSCVRARLIRMLGFYYISKEMKMTTKCFVIMPSGNHDEYTGGVEESEFIYTGIICPAVRSALGEDVKVIREADKMKSGAITSEIIRQIAECDIAIVDITGQNPNVFLELGVRYALRKSTTIVLKQSTTPVPFDINNFRYILYRPQYNDIDKARKDIQAALLQSSDEQSCDSLVYEVYPNLAIFLPPIDGKLPNAETRMPWSAYKQRLKQVVSKAIDTVRDVRYVPIAIIGITNGGMMFADLLARELFGGTIPTVSLWANRKVHNDYFGSDINRATAQAIAKMAAGSQDASILLVDDIVASGSTHHQAIEFLKKSLSGVDIRFLPLFSRNEKYFDLIKEHMLWNHSAFNIPDEEISHLHDTDWLRLPYDKDIRST
jgi:hypoxanthine phosphoribosyltransferase